MEGARGVSDEQLQWKKMIEELQELFTLADLAAEFNVTLRQVSNWKHGDRPKGMKAVKVYLFHAKHCIPPRNAPRGT